MCTLLFTFLINKSNVKSPLPKFFGFLTVFHGTVMLTVSVVKTQYPRKGWSVSAAKYELVCGSNPKNCVEDGRGFSDFAGKRASERAL